MGKLKFFKNANLVCFALLHILVQDEHSDVGRRIQARNLSEFISSIFPSSFGSAFSDDDDLLREDDFRSGEEGDRRDDNSRRSCDSDCIGRESCTRGNCLRGELPTNGISTDDRSDDFRSCTESVSCGCTSCKGLRGSSGDMTDDLVGHIADHSLDNRANDRTEDTVEGAVRGTLGDDIERRLNDRADVRFEKSLEETLDDDDVEERADRSLNDRMEDAVKNTLDGTVENVLGDNAEDNMLNPDEDLMDDDSFDLGDDPSDDLLIDLKFADPYDLDASMNEPYDSASDKVSEDAAECDCVENSFCPFNNTSSYDGKISDLSEVLSEEQLDEKVFNLGSVVDVKDMYTIWNYVNDNEKRKFYSMRTILLTYCDCLADACGIPFEIKKQEWLRIHRFMNRVFLRYEKRFAKYTHSFLKRGRTERCRFVDFLSNYKAKCNKFRNIMYNYWKSNIFTRMEAYQRFLDGVSSRDTMENL
ncbi:hypothetical protein AK88_04177 [Plasmodium fragile]|uniref:Plasmodium RESA N-terminal domain-containing protein n=1 Tax=Plasmodium fragile TaxID=5857 RepID=A0A0D9QKH0_PLAFR|nr:uncharacterized protein AK88_04177 [Plasmodium fragile]KJP86206.1 hypothetical protein AK88_04177 [Plasmodium fragile]